MSFYIFTFQNSRPRKCRSAVALIDSKQPTSYLSDIVRFSPPLIVCEIFANQEKKTLTLRMKIKVKKKRNGTCAIRQEIIEPMQFILS